MLLSLRDEDEGNIVGRIRASPKEGLGQWRGLTSFGETGVGTNARALEPENDKFVGAGNPGRRHVSLRDTFLAMGWNLQPMQGSASVPDTMRSKLVRLFMTPFVLSALGN